MMVQVIGEKMKERISIVLQVKAFEKAGLETTVLQLAQNQSKLHLFLILRSSPRALWSSKLVQPLLK